MGYLKKGTTMTNMTKMTLVALGASLLASTATAASFNCSNAATPTEKAICGDKYLSKLDGQMGTIYKKASTHANIKHEQHDWINHRNRNCGADEDCLYNMTKKRISSLKHIIKRGGGTHKPANHGSVFSPERGVVCDKKSGFCADAYGISLGMTKDFLGKKQQDTWSKRITKDFDTTAFTMSNKVFCDTNVRTCYSSKLKDKVDHYFTNRLFR
jgi:uncharacterized protein